MNQEIYHIPALLDASLDGLDIKPDGTYVDVTLGGGGHSRAILKRLSPAGHLYSFDQDSDAIARAAGDPDFDNPSFTPVHGNFRFLANYMDFYGQLNRVDGILADLGVSFHHFDDAARGFSFRADGPLDMRMNPDARLTAADLVAGAEQAELARIFKLYGELPRAAQIARALVAEREKAPIDTTARLTAAVMPLISKQKEKKELAQVFQALRIAVNGEMEALENFLRQTLEVLRPGGRLAVITYHSLEDRMVKNFMRTGTTDGTESKDFFGRNTSPIEPLMSKPIVPTEAEIESNPRSRSAKLRVAVKR